jgi:two-component system, NarL family, sensor kinase
MTLDTLVMIGITGMITLSFGLIYFVVFHQRRVFKYHIEKMKAQQEHEQQLQIVTQEAQEQTMSRLASELHDDVGVTLSSVKLFLSKSSNKNPELIQQSQQLLDESIEKIRNLSHQLHPATLQHLGLAIAIQSMLSVIERSGSIRTEFDATTITEKLPEQIELPLFRIVQELLNNLMKHSGLSKISIMMLLQQENSLSIKINHDGIGLDNETYQAEILKKGAIGLKSIYNRLQLLKGTINFEELQSQDFQISITTPLNQ